MELSSITSVHFCQVWRCMGSSFDQQSTAAKYSAETDKPVWHWVHVLRRSWISQCTLLSQSIGMGIQSSWTWFSLPSLQICPTKKSESSYSSWEHWYPCFPSHLSHLPCSRHLLLCFVNTLGQRIHLCTWTYIYILSCVPRLLDAFCMSWGISKLDNPYRLLPPNKTRHSPILDRLASRRTGPKRQWEVLIPLSFCQRNSSKSLQSPLCKPIVKL